MSGYGHPLFSSELRSPGVASAVPCNPGLLRSQESRE